jgi:hypothetical protein
MKLHLRGLLLVGFILFLYLLGGISVVAILPAFLVGVGLIFIALGFVRSSTHDPAGKMYLAYGVLALGIGVIWLSWAIQLVVAEFALAGVLILFGCIFLLYSTATNTLFLGRRQSMTTQTTTTTTQMNPTITPMNPTITPMNQQRVCGNCGANLGGPQARFCDKCGATN